MRGSNSGASYILEAARKMQDVQITDRLARRKMRNVKLQQVKIQDVNMQGILKSLSFHCTL